jgi:deazaflavin-dependent oxidoreductase (nitroreductase family)
MDMKETNRVVIERFRTGEDIPGMHRDRLLLLTTTGRASGEPRTTPLMFSREGERVYVVASNNGAPENPGWYRNLVRSASVLVEVGGERYEAAASPLEGEERARVWAEITTQNPFFLEHQAGAGREIPVVELERSRD